MLRRVGTSPGPCYDSRVKERETPMIHKTDSGRIYYLPYNVTKAEALRRMEEAQKRYDEDVQSGQALFDEMFGG